MTPRGNRIQRDPILDVLKAIKQARQFTRYLSREDLAADERSIFAVTRALDLLSLASRRFLQNPYPYKVQQFSNVPWDVLAGLGRQLSQRYGPISPEALWRTIEELPIFEALILANLEREQAQEETQPELSRLIISADDILTTDFLKEVVTPFLTALSDLQKIIDDIQGIENSKVIVRSITYYSPVSVTLEGASQAAGFVRDSIVKWRREHAHSMALLAEREKLADIENKKAELLEKRVRAIKDKAEAEKILAEAALQREQAERARLENEKIRLELQHDKIQLALELMRQLAPNLSETEKLSYLVRLLPTIDTLVSNRTISQSK